MSTQPRCESCREAEAQYQVCPECLSVMERQVQAVKERLRPNGAPEPGDLLYNASGNPVARIMRMTSEHGLLEGANSRGVLRKYDTGISTIRIEAEGVFP